MHPAFTAVPSTGQQRPRVSPDCQRVNSRFLFQQDISVHGPHPNRASSKQSFSPLSTGLQRPKAAAEATSTKQPFSPLSTGIQRPTSRRGSDVNKTAVFTAPTGHQHPQVSRRGSDVPPKLAVVGPRPHIATASPPQKITTTVMTKKRKGGNSSTNQAPKIALQRSAHPSPAPSKTS